MAKDSGKKDYLADLDKIIVRSAQGRHAYSLKFKLSGRAVLNAVYVTFK